MQITRETDYALRCVLYLSARPGKIIDATEIAESKSIPRSFLSKILQKLTRAGIVKSFKGYKGGFMMMKIPREISVLDIIEIFEGPAAMNRCAIDKQSCQLSPTCSVHPIWVEIRQYVDKKLKQQTFDKLLKKFNALERAAKKTKTSAKKAKVPAKVGKAVTKGAKVPAKVGRAAAKK
jgi:Rrf2 family protein